MPESGIAASKKSDEKKVFSQEDYAILKKKLQIVGFDQDVYPLGFDSIALVGKMLLEYVTVTNLFTQTQEILTQEQLAHQQEKEQLEDKLAQTTQERDYLAKTLAAFEKDATNIANQVQIVTRERDELQKKLEQTPTKNFNPESDQLRKLLEENDQQRDQMQYNTDSLKEELDACKLELSEKQLLLDNARKELQMERENRLLVTNQLWEKEREMQSIRRQTEKITGEKSKIQVENKVIREQLESASNGQVTFSQERENLVKELYSLALERDDVSHSLEQLRIKVEVLEQTVKAQEKEKEAYLQIHQTLSAQNAQLDINSQHLQRECSSLRNDIQDKNAEIKQMLGYIEEVETENGKYVSELRGYEKKTFEFMQTVQNLERKVKDLTNEKQLLQRESSGVAEINESLEKAIVAARIEVADLVKQSNELSAKIREVQAEKEVVLTKLQRQIAHSRELEELLKIEKVKENRRDIHPTIEELQRKIDEQAATLKSMHKERKQLKQYVVRYESELLRNEHQVSVLVNKVKELEGQLSNNSSRSETHDSFESYLRSDDHNTATEQM